MKINLRHAVLVLVLAMHTGTLLFPKKHWNQIMLTSLDKVDEHFLTTVLSS